VFETENDSTVSFIFDTLAFFEIGCDYCHIREVMKGETDSLKRQKCRNLLFLGFVGEVSAIE